jgi:hypothetical protein
MGAFAFESPCDLRRELNLRRLSLLHFCTHTESFDHQSMGDVLCFDVQCDFLALFDRNFARFEREPMRHNGDFVGVLRLLMNSAAPHNRNTRREILRLMTNILAPCVGVSFAIARQTCL